MLDIFRLSRGKPEPASRAARGCWISAIDPTPEELARLRAIIDVPEDVVASLRDSDEMPTIEPFGAALFILIRTPQRNADAGNRGAAKEQYRTVPLGILLSRRMLATVCFSQNDVVERLKAEKVSGGIPAVLRLLLVSAKTSLRYLKEINKQIYAIQQDLEVTTKNEEILQLLGYRKSLVSFNSALRAESLLIRRIAKRRDIRASPELSELMDDVIEENRQAIEMVTIYSKILDGTMSAFGSVISNKLNMRIKVLTSVTIILMIPTLVASVYGMNITLPFQQHPESFVIVMALSAAFSVLGALALRGAGWLGWPRRGRYKSVPAK